MTVPAKGAPMIAAGFYATSHMSHITKWKHRHHIKDRSWLPIQNRSVSTRTQPDQADTPSPRASSSHPTLSTKPPPGHNKFNSMLSL